MRTNQQLGYVVDARVHLNRHIMGYRFLVQSNGHSSEDLHNRVNDFIISKRKEINEISDADFDQAKGAIMTEISEKDKNLSEESSRLLR